MAKPHQPRKFTPAILVDPQPEPRDCLEFRKNSRYYVYGCSNTGKTNLIFSLIGFLPEWKELYVVAPDLNNPTISAFIDIAEKLVEEDPELLIKFIDDFDEIPDLADLAANPCHRVIIFDDFIKLGNKTVKKVSEFAIRSRGVGCSTFVITQTWTGNKDLRDIRDNCEYLIIFGGVNKRTVRGEIANYLPEIDSAVFDKFYRAVTSTKEKKPIMIDLTSFGPMRVRAGIDTPVFDRLKASSS